MTLNLTYLDFLAFITVFLLGGVSKCIADLIGYLKKLSVEVGFKLPRMLRGFKASTSLLVCAIKNSPYQGLFGNSLEVRAAKGRVSSGAGRVLSYVSALGQSTFKTMNFFTGSSILASLNIRFKFLQTSLGSYVKVIVKNFIETAYAFTFFLKMIFNSVQDIVKNTIRASLSSVQVAFTKSLKALTSAATSSLGKALTCTTQLTSHLNYVPESIFPPPRRAWEKSIKLQHLGEKAPAFKRESPLDLYSVTVISPLSVLLGCGFKPKARMRLRAEIGRGSGKRVCGYISQTGADLTQSELGNGELMSRPRISRLQSWRMSSTSRLSVIPFRSLNRLRDITTNICISPSLSQGSPRVLTVGGTAATLNNISTDFETKPFGFSFPRPMDASVSGHDLEDEWLASEALRAPRPWKLQLNWG